MEDTPNPIELFEDSFKFKEGGAKVAGAFNQGSQQKPQATRSEVPVNPRGASMVLTTVIDPPEPSSQAKFRKPCNCRNSKCLKLYCECFASGFYCQPGKCNCNPCNNNSNFESIRQSAVQ